MRKPLQCGHSPETSMRIRSVATRPYADQKPGTSGLRKKVPVFRGELAPWNLRPDSL
jgi:hypothetical protein